MISISKKNKRLSNFYYNLCYTLTIETDKERLLKMEKEEKLKHIIKKLKLTTKEIAKKLEVTSSLISQLKSEYKTSTPLRNIHIYAFCLAYDVPVEIFKDESIDTHEKIDRRLEQEQLQQHDMFGTDSRMMEKLVGEWYMYSYPSNPQLAEVWEIQTTFHPNGTVIDEHNNSGYLHIGKNQSIIYKESNGTKNINTITFDNARVHYNIFIFSRVSKSNSINKEIFNFGICSRDKIPLDEVKIILGEINEVQLQMNYAMLDRVGKYTTIGRKK